MKQFLNAFFYAGLVFLTPVITFGQCYKTERLCNPLKAQDLMEIIEFLLFEILVQIVAPIVVVLMLIWAGFDFIAAQGNSNKVTDAKNKLLYVVIGAVILLGAVVIYEIVVATVNALIA